MPAAKQRFRQKLRAAFVAVVLSLIVLAMGFLARDVARQLRGLESASSDNAHWVLMQNEVEVLRFQIAVGAALAAGPGVDLSDVRRHFDVLYSRVGIIEESPFYTALVEQPGYDENYMRMRNFLDRVVVLIDGPDQELVASLPQLYRQLADQRSAARGLTLKGLSDTAAHSDARRSDILSTLLRLAVLTLVLILLLAAILLMLVRQYRRSLAWTEENQLAAIRLKTIIETSADGILVTNRGGWIIEVNPAAEAIVGYSREQMLGRRAVELLFPADKAEDQIRQVEKLLASGGTRSSGPVEMEGLSADGRRIPIELSIGVAEAPPRPDNGRSGSTVVAVLRDISDREMTERQLTQALDRARAGEKARAEFVAVMSHEMRTPLNGMIGAAELLAQGSLTPDQAKLVAAILGAGDILLGHANAVLDLTRAEAGQIIPEMTRFDLDKLIEECLANQAGLTAAAGIGLSHVTPGGPVGEVMGDLRRVRQILLNLIGNAVKFTPKGTVTVESERQGEIVEIRVIDTGIGIREEDLERVFDDFVTLDHGYSRRVSGTGLGLGIARRIARTMGGEIGVESEPDDGSVFWIRLPLPAAGQETEDGCPTRDVLVIEDNPLNRFLLVQHLTDAGHRVAEAAEGAEGVRLAESRAFDVIFTDISMPGLDGIEATRRIRTGGGLSRRARIVAVTAHALPDELARFRAVGIDDCLVKPVARSTLLASMRTNGTLLTPPIAPRILDRMRLAELSAQIGPAPMRSLIARLLAEGDALAAVIAAGHVPAPKDVHALAGSAATFGAAALQRALTAHSGGDASVRAEIPALWAETRSALETEVQALA